MIKYVVFVVILMSVFSCSKEKKSNDAEYRVYNLANQGWKSKRINQFVNDINYSVTEVPLQYYILKEVGENYSKIDSIYKSNERERVLEIEFQQTEQQDLLQNKFTNKTYDDAVKYMAFKLNNDLKVVSSSGDTIPCSGVTFERNFKVAPFKRALLYFNNINPEDHIKLIYNDNLFGNGIIKFNFTQTPIKL